MCNFQHISVIAIWSIPCYTACGLMPTVLVSMQEVHGVKLQVEPCIDAWINCAGGSHFSTLIDIMTIKHFTLYWPFVRGIISHLFTGGFSWFEKIHLYPHPFGEHHLWRTIKKLAVKIFFHNVEVKRSRITRNTLWWGNFCKAWIKPV